LNRRAALGALAAATLAALPQSRANFKVM